MSPRKPGAQPGNTNARKHGLYAKIFITRNSLNVEQKKAILDSCIVRMFELFKTLSDLDDLSKCLNSLSIAVTASNNCERTQAILTGNYTPIEDVLNALKYLDPDED